MGRWFLEKLVDLFLIPLVAAFIWAVVATETWDEYLRQLRVEGQPVTFEEIDARRPSIPDDRNSALVVARLEDRLITIGEEAKLLPIIKLEVDADFYDGIPRHAIRPTRRFIRRHRDVLGELQKLRELPYGRMPRDWSDPTLEDDPDRSRRYRVACKLLAANVYLMIIDGRREEAWDQVRVNWNLGAGVADEPSVIWALVRMASDSVSLHMIAASLRTGSVPRATLAEWQAVLKEHADLQRLRYAWWGERAYLAHLLEDILVNKWPSLVSDRVSPLMTDGYIRANQRRICDALAPLIAANGDPAEMMRQARAADAWADSWGWFHKFAKILTPARTNVTQLNARIHAEEACARLALAAELYRLDHGSFPRSLDELVPRYIEAVPRDPFDERPLKMAVTRSGLTVYSVLTKAAENNPSAEDPTEPDSNCSFRLFRPERREVVILDDP